ncbi:hypothetical protein [Methylobacter sp.]|uniref:hypothetical protein n=1 Tax=Methylobacter sp. TaxID=2051955 RepID=UPI003DA3D10B
MKFGNFHPDILSKILSVKLVLSLTNKSADKTSNFKKLQLKASLKGCGTFGDARMNPGRYKGKVWSLRRVKF